MPKINHKRIKKKYNPTPNASEKRYHDYIRSLGCILCGTYPKVHHQIHKDCCDGIEDRQTKDHMQVIPLCEFHHVDSKQGWHGLGSNWKFYQMYGIDLVKESQRLLDEYSNSM